MVGQDLHGNTSALSLGKDICQSLTTSAWSTRYRTDTKFCRKNKQFEIWCDSMIKSIEYHLRRPIKVHFFGNLNCFTGISVFSDAHDHVDTSQSAITYPFKHTLTAHWYVPKQL